MTEPNNHDKDHLNACIEMSRKLRHVYCDKQENGLFSVVIDGHRFLMEPEHPGWSHVNTGAYNVEIRDFLNVLDIMKDIDAPVMIELGSHWALWSLIFRNRFPKGTNILVEINSDSLQIGMRNFALSNLDCIPYHGGSELSSAHGLGMQVESATVALAEAGIIGPECDFMSLWDHNNLQHLDLLHMDIQGSELALLQNNQNLLAEHRISNIVIGTHDHLHDHAIHEPVREILIANGYTIRKDIPCKTDDGYIWAHYPKKPE